MFLNIKDTGIQINQELADLISQRYEGIEFGSIYINLDADTKHKEVDIVYPNIELCPNPISLEREDLNQNIIDWLNTL